MFRTLLLALAICFAVTVSSRDCGAQEASTSEGVSDTQNYDPEAFKLIQEGRFREALDKLVKAVEVQPNDSKVYATLSLLYERIRECPLAWKYYELAKDLGHLDRDLKRSLRSLCKKPKERARKEILEFEKTERGPLLTIQFSPKQLQWPFRAKFPVFQPTKKRGYLQLTLDQIRKVRKLSGMTVPWIVTGDETLWQVQIVSGDGWITLITTLPVQLDELQ